MLFRSTIAFNPNDDRLLIYNIDPDTLPLNTLDAVDSVINPQNKAPNIVDPDDPTIIVDNYGLPYAELGQRYLIVEDIGPDVTVWGGVTAYANDIIQCVSVDPVTTQGTWEVVFDSTQELNTQFVTNLTTEVQYRFAEGVWMKSYEGWYGQGDYSIVI